MPLTAALVGAVVGWTVGENVFDALGLSDFLGAAPVERHVAAAITFALAFYFAGEKFY